MNTTDEPDPQSDYNAPLHTMDRIRWHHWTCDRRTDEILCRVIGTLQLLALGSLAVFLLR